MVHDLETLKQLNDQACSDSIARLVSFVDRIKTMNETFELESNNKVVDLGYERLTKFYNVIKEEIDEIDDLLKVDISEEEINTCKIDLVGLADVLGDIVVYVFSEARRWGIPILDVLHIIMDSQDSKLVDGKPLKAPDGSKFIKGPNYVPPEERIDTLLSRIMKEVPS